MEKAYLGKPEEPLRKLIPRSDYIDFRVTGVIVSTIITSNH